MRPFALLALSAAMSTSAFAAEAKRESFGTLSDGRIVEAVRLTNRRGVSVRVMTLGASIQSVVLPDREGKTADVVLGYDSLGGYEKAPQFFGATVGRVANRIANGKFTFDGKDYAVPLNGGPNSLHGGIKGFDKVVWTIREVRHNDTQASVTLRYVSPNGDQGYPGQLTTDATYTLDEQGQLTINYTATTDRPTLVNLSNHTYWNLAGPGTSAMDHVLTIPADRYTPTDPTSIPLGRHRAVAGTAFDFRKPTPVGARIREGSEEQIGIAHGYDHNWVIRDAVTADQHLMARVTEPGSGRGFEIWSNQPGLQFYSGNFFNGTIAGKSGKIYRAGDAVVLEPQSFPDAPNQPAFPSIRLDPGKTYRNVITYKFFAE